MNAKLGLIIGGVVLCVVLGIFGWITVTGSSTERYLQLLLFLAPTMASLFGIQVGVKAQQTAEETKAIVSPTNGEYRARALDAYNAYAAQMNYVGGSSLPKFDDLGAQAKLAWYDAVRAGNGEKVG